MINLCPKHKEEADEAAGGKVIVVDKIQPRKPHPPTGEPPAYLLEEKDSVEVTLQGPGRSHGGEDKSYNDILLVEEKRIQYLRTQPRQCVMCGSILIFNKGITGPIPSIRSDNPDAPQPGGL